MNHAATFPRRVLLAVTGMSPQIVTETLYALATQQNFVPTEIHIITTQQGKNLLLSQLLDPQRGQFHAFCQEYGLTGCIAFDADSIHVITDSNGIALADIRSPQDNQRAADAITDLVRDLCADKDMVLHASLAGGRKTMGFYLGYALSLFARPQDQLSHVLVSESFETNRDFYFPPRQATIITDPQGKELNTADAQVMLADIPLVRLRNSLPPEALATGRASYSETVRVAQQGLDSVSLSFDLDQQTVIFGERRVRLPPAQLATMLWLARDSKQGRAIEPGADYATGFLWALRQLDPDRADRATEQTSGVHDGPDAKQAFREHLSKIRRKLRKELGAAISTYNIVRSGARNDYRYRLGLAPERIQLPPLRHGTHAEPSPTKPATPRKSWPTYDPPPAE